LDYTYNYGGITITGYSGPGGAVLIPPTIHGLPVTTIAYEAFFNMSNITSVAIPTNVNTIEQGAFLACTGLTNIAIPNSITSIGEQVFDGCSNLASVTIPDSVIGIGYGAFWGCSRLTSVAIPNSVTSIGYAAFSDCSSLTSITIPNSVTSIGDWAFGECDSLTNATIPSGVSNLPYSLFIFCNSLSNVYFQGNAPAFGTIYLPPDFTPAFWTDTNVTVYYLPGTTGWGNTYQGVPAVLWNPLIQTGGGNFGVQNNQFGFDIKGTAGIPIVVEACTNLGDPVWTALTNVRLTNGLFHFSEPAQAASAGRFYRISSP